MPSDQRAGHWALARGHIPFLLLHHFLGLCVRQLVGFGLVLLEDVLDLLLGLLGLVLGHGLGFLFGLDVLVGVAADVPAGDLGVLGQLLDLLGHLGPLFAGHGRNLEPNHLP